MTCKGVAAGIPLQVRFSFRRVHPYLLAVLLLAALPRYGVSADSGDSPAANKSHEKPYALIFGTVWGPDDRPVSGVPISVRRDDQKKAHWHLVSDHNGEFALRVPAGRADYVVWAELKNLKMLPGKQLSPGQEAHVHIENDERFDLGLHLTLK